MISRLRLVDGHPEIIRACAICETSRNLPPRVDILATGGSTGEIMVSVDLCAGCEKPLRAVWDQLAEVGLTGLVDAVRGLEMALMRQAQGKPDHRDTRSGRRDQRLFTVVCPLCRKRRPANVRYQHLQSSHGMSKEEANRIDFTEIEGEPCPVANETGCTARLEEKVQAGNSHLRSRHPGFYRGPDFERCCRDIKRLLAIRDPFPAEEMKAELTKLGHNHHTIVPAKKHVGARSYRAADPNGGWHWFWTRKST